MKELYDSKAYAKSIKESRPNNHKVKPVEVNLILLIILRSII